MSDLYGKGTRFGNQTPTLHIHNPESSSFYDLEVISGSIDRWISHPFPWQKIMYRDIFAEKDGKLTTKVFCLSLPRRNGKTEGIIGTMVIFAVMFSANVLYTASDGKLAKTTYARFIEAATSLDSNLRNYFPGLELKDKAHEHVITAFDPKTGQKLGSLTFVTRKGKGGRGSTYDVVIIDEAQDLTEEQYQRYGPTNAANKKHDRGKKKNPIGLTLLIGTPPPLDTKTDSLAAGTVFRSVREEVLAEKDLPFEERRKKGTVWLEWGADSVIDKTDRDAWFRYNPSMGYLGGMEEYFEESILSAEGFSVEHLGYWTKQSKERAIEISSFNKLVIPKEGITQKIKEENCKFAVSIKSTLNERAVHLGVAWRRADGSIFYDQLKTFYTEEPGWDQQLGAMASHLTKNRLCMRTTVDGSIASAAIKTAFIKNGLWNSSGSKILQGKVLMATVGDVTAAAASLMLAISSKKLQHCNSTPLHSAVEDAKKRPIGDKGYSFASISGVVDIIPLEVCAMAVYGLELKAQIKPVRARSGSSKLKEIFN